MGVGALIQQKIADRDGVFFGGGFERLIAPVRVGEMDVGSGFDQEADAVEASVGGGAPQGCAESFWAFQVAAGAEGVHVGSGFDQEAGYGIVAGAGEGCSGVSGVHRVVGWRGLP
jgi:hypothetical protein